jgi:hypothetical protein
MLEAVEITSCRPTDAIGAAAEALEGEFPGLAVRASVVPEPLEEPRAARLGQLVVVPVAVWEDPAFDLFSVDDLVHAAASEAKGVTLRIEGLHAARGNPIDLAVQVVTRFQRLLRTRNRHSVGRLFDRVLQLHRGLHDLGKPLVAADYAHALDVWRWVLRLEPDASAAVQLAALFHDVERLVTESRVRVEQHAHDYARFKAAHARAGAQIARRALREVGADEALAERVAALVETHEAPDADPEKALLNEADALSFFSLNAPGFLSYYGRPHTERKIAFTLGRLGREGWARLRRVRHRADVEALVRAAIDGRGAERGAPVRSSAAPGPLEAAHP